MELSSDSYTLLGKDEKDRVKLKYTLLTTPDRSWTKTFNRYSSKIKSINNSTSIIVLETTNNLLGIDISDKITTIIDMTDDEIISNELKKNILLTSLPQGFIIGHDGLDFNDTGSGSPFQQYLETVASREFNL